MTIDCVTRNGSFAGNDNDRTPCFVCMSDFLTLLRVLSVVNKDDNLSRLIEDEEAVGVCELFPAMKKQNLRHRYIAISNNVFITHSQ